MLARPGAFLLVLALASAGCLGPSSVEALPPAGPPVYNYEQEFSSTTLRGSLVLRTEIEPQAGEVCIQTLQATIVRSTGRFSMFYVSETAKGAKYASPYGATPGGFGATILGTRSQSLVDGPIVESIKWPARFNETRARVVTMYFEDLDATRAPFKIKIQCPSDPVRIDLSGGRQGAILDPSRNSVAYAEAELCPDMVVGAGGTKAIHLDAGMRFWFTSQPAIGLVEVQGPASKSWDLAQKHEAETLVGGPGDYRLNLHRFNIDQTGGYDGFAGAIGAFPALSSLDDLNVGPKPRAAQDSPGASCLG